MTSTFERTYQTDPSREIKIERECGRIELTDQEHLERVRLNQGMVDAGFIYKPPVMDEESMSPALKEKFEKARNLTKDTKITKLGQKDAKSKSKSTTSKPKKNNPKSNKPAVASIQKEL